MPIYPEEMPIDPEEKSFFGSLKWVFSHSGESQKKSFATLFRSILPIPGKIFLKIWCQNITYFVKWRHRSQNEKICTTFYNKVCFNSTPQVVV